MPRYLILRIMQGAFHAGNRNKEIHEPEKKEIRRNLNRVLAIEFHDALTDEEFENFIGD